MMKKVILGIFLLTASVQASGCFALFVGAAVGAGSAIWITGKLQQSLNASLDKAHRASLGALRRLELPILVDRKDKTTAKIESQYADGKRVWIDLEYQSKNVTKIAIRVGTLGDEVRSREILDNIIRQL